MTLQYHDGGAFADFPFIQFPGEMGKQRAPSTVVSAAAAAALATRSTQNAPAISEGHRDRPLATMTASSRAISASLPSTVQALVVLPSSSGSARAVGGASSALQRVASSHPSSTAAARPIVETADETTTRTAQALEDTLAATHQTTEVFDSRSLVLQSRLRVASNRPNALKGALVIGEAGGAAAGTSDPSPVVRSPTKEKKSMFTDALLLRQSSHSKASGKTTGNHSVVTSSAEVGATSSSASMMAAASAGGSLGGATSAAHNRKVVVPFCVSSWQNRKKLIVPVEQRLAQQQDSRLDLEGGVGDAVMDLAIAMQQASKEVTAELAEKERVRAEEEERRQAALEAEEAEKARQLLERKAAELAAHAQRRETREERRERLRLERELREQEKSAKRQQRLREKAAARLNISLDELEADEQLLRTVEEASVYAGAADRRGSAGVPSPQGGASVDPTAAPVSSLIKREWPGDHDGAADGDDGGAMEEPRKPAVRGGVFASAVISNEGIQREMNALADLEGGPTQQQQHDGLRLREANEDDASNDDDDDEDEHGGFQLRKFVKKKQRL